MSIFRLSTEQLNTSNTPLEDILSENRTARHVKEDFSINPTLFKEICAALIVQIDGHECEKEPVLHFTNYTRTQGNYLALISVQHIDLCILILYKYLFQPGSTHSQVFLSYQHVVYLDSCCYHSLTRHTMIMFWDF